MVGQRGHLLRLFNEPTDVEFDFYSHNGPDAYRGLMVFLKTAGQDVNTTPEGKANNRRVEFARIG